MDIYYYCSYTGSPVGFILGKLSYDGSSRTHELQNIQISPLIRKCFESGNVRKAFGALPEKPNTDFFLIKKLQQTGDNPNGPAEFFMNIAFATSDHEQFRKWLQSGTQSQEEIAKLVRDSIELDGTSPYGYVVRGGVLEKLVGCSFGDFFNLSESDLEKSGPTLELLSTANIESVARQLSLTQSGKQLLPLQDNWVRWMTIPPTKTRTINRTTSGDGRRNWMCIAIGIGIAAAALIIVLCSR